MKLAFCGSLFGILKKILNLRLSKKNVKKTKKFDSIDAMGRSIFQKDCLKPVEYAYNN